MKNPNNYGTVVKLSGNRRRPYAVRKTIGYTDDGNPIRKCIGYTASKEEGLILLAEYNKNPYDLDTKNITFKELYELWYTQNIHKFATTTKASYYTAFNATKELHHLKYATLKLHHLQTCIDNCQSGSTKNKVRALLTNLDKYALAHDIIVRSYTALIETPSIERKKEKIPFTYAEINMLWKNLHVPYVDTILILLYTGLRINELLSLKLENIDLESKIIQGGSKTASGKNRIVPIHYKILPIVQKYYTRNSQYLIEYNCKPLNYHLYIFQWNTVMQALNIRHTTHECRHTVRSELDRKGGNKVCIDRIIGHKSQGTGEAVYTHKTIEELRATIELISY